MLEAALRVRQVWDNLRQVAVSPRKLVLLASGSFGRQLLVAMTLSVALRAFGDHLWLPVLIVIITLVGIIGGISPSPGGMGVVEVVPQLFERANQFALVLAMGKPC